MVTTRQDAWSEEEDVLLSEVVLRHIREGGMQLSAFKEVGRHLSRTAAACGFRWNSYVRKLYKPGIDEAKRSRKERHGYTHEQSQVENTFSKISVKSEFEGTSINQVIEILQSIRDGTYEYKSVQQLQEENKQLYAEKNELIDRLTKLEEEYVSFFEYVDKKRSIVVLDAGDRSNRGKSIIEKVEK